MDLLLASMKPELDQWVMVVGQIGMLIFIAAFIALMVKLVLIKDKKTTERYSSMPLDDADSYESGDDARGSVHHV